MFNKIIIILFIIFLTLFLFLIIKLYKNQPRRMHANELIENFDYSIKN
jgi:hypothetical protein